MKECPHSAEHITLVEDRFLECKVRCERCGQVFTEKGWGIRGVGRAYGDGIIGFFRNLLVGTIVDDIKK